MSDKNQQGEQISTKGSEKKNGINICAYIFILIAINLLKKMMEKAIIIIIII